jgi:hypothetical protein
MVTGEGRQTTPFLSIYIVLRCLISLIRQEKARKNIMPESNTNDYDGTH